MICGLYAVSTWFYPQRGLLLEKTHNHAVKVESQTILNNSRQYTGAQEVRNVSILSLAQHRCM